MSYPIYTASDTGIWLRLTGNYTYRKREELGEEVTSFLKHQKAFKIAVPPKKQATRGIMKITVRGRIKNF